MWAIFKSLLIHKTIPMKKIRNNKKIKPKWMNGEIGRKEKEKEK